jgi:hypothetical protein
VSTIRTDLKKNPNMIFNEFLKVELENMEEINEEFYCMAFFRYFRESGNSEMGLLFGDPKKTAISNHLEDIAKCGLIPNPKIV